MAQHIEETLRKCAKCKKTTKHYRNNSSSSAFAVLIHLVLAVLTMGVWLVLIVIWKVLNAKIGGWRCSECVK